MNQMISEMVITESLIISSVHYTQAQQVVYELSTGTRVPIQN